MTSVTEARVKRLEERFGKLEDQHASGMSLAELKDKYGGRFLAFSGEVLGISYWTPQQLDAIESQLFAAWAPDAHAEATAIESALSTIGANRGRAARTVAKIAGIEPELLGLR